MVISGPSNVTVVQPLASVHVNFSIELEGHSWTILYGPPGGPFKAISGALPGALQTAIENHCKAAVEAAEGWGAGTSTVVTP